MRKLLLSGVAIAAISVAAEGPAKAAPPVIYNWTGCYIGGNIGGSKADKNFLPDFTTDGAGPAKPFGLAGGTQFGCDVQSGMWVFGAQGMFDWTDLSGDSPFRIGKGYTVRMPWFATAAGRVGYLPQPNLLVFFKGGAAFVRDQFQFVENNGLRVDAVAHSTRTGRLFAGGVEWMPVPNWSITVEYDYMGFGTKVIDFQGIGFFPSFSNRVEQHVQAVLVSVNYRFGSGGGR